MSKTARRLLVKVGVDVHETKHAGNTCWYIPVAHISGWPRWIPGEIL